MRVQRAIALLSAAALLAACSSSSASPSAAEAGTIDATLTEWSITLGSATASAGEITFNITNDGEKTHEFVVVSTDLDADSLPVVEDEVPEDQLTPVDEVEDIAAGATPTLTVNLEPGHYVILCNLTAHYGKGMHADLTVN
jgi:uncharacterized cupredoxin-like copper-binding protein